MLEYLRNDSKDVLKMIIAKVGKKPTLEIPLEVYDSLGLSEDQEVGIEITLQNKPIKRLTDEALANIDATQGIWADDDKIAEAFEYLDRKWKEWKPIEF